MKSVRIIGVPEHFNLPWHMAIEDGAFSDRGFDVQFQNIPEGTGKMASMLQNNEADLAIILTEGIIKSIADGSPARIIQEYIASPLLWGIHVAAQSPYTELSQLTRTTAAISRLGSGSHLMAFVLASQNNWDTSKLNFKIVNTLDGAVEALTNGEADYFLWEHFTTKPLVDQGIFRHLGDCPTPWPCFVIAAGGEFLENNPNISRHILDVINTYTADFKNIPSIDRTLANQYGIDLADIKKWLAITRWSQSQISTHTIDNVQDTLLELEIISKKIPSENYSWSVPLFGEL